MTPFLINHKFSNPKKGAVEFKLDCSGGCTKAALALLIQQFQDIYKEMNG